MISYRDQLRDPKLFLREVHMANKPKTRKWQRLGWDVVHLFDTKSFNPMIDEDNEEPGLKAKHRTGLQDITHAVKNLWQSPKR